MARPSRFSPEVRERAVRMVFEHTPEHASQWAAITSIAEKIGCAAGSSSCESGADSGNYCYESPFILTAASSEVTIASLRGFPEGERSVPMKRVPVLLFLLMFLSVAVASVAAEPVARSQYTFAAIDVPGASFTQAFGVNDAGHVVGAYGSGGATYGFLLVDGVFTTIAPLGATFTQAYDINNRGEIVGVHNAGGVQAFLYTEGTFQSFQVPGGSNSAARAVNRFTAIVGDYSTSTGGHGFLFNRGDFDTIDVPGATNTAAFGINDREHIVGYYSDGAGNSGFLWRNGDLAVIQVPGSSNTQALGVNNAGLIVGTYVWGASHGFLLHRRIFTTIDVPGASNTAIYKINRFREFVGTITDANGAHGFIATSVHKRVIEAEEFDDDDDAADD